MAYAAVASLSQTIDLLLNHHQNSISPELKNQMISLQEHTSFLESFLEDSPQKVNFWEEGIIWESADMAENIIELLLSDSFLTSKPTVGSSRSEFAKGKKKYQLPYGFDELERVTREIESIINRLKGINTDAMDGPDEELMKIISLLRGGSGSSCTVIGICGREGMGSKTTLARNAYNNPLIVDHFDVRGWSTVSKENSVLQIASDLLRSMKVEKSISNSEDELIQSLFEELDGRRYLIVLDGLRSFEILRRLEEKLPDNGSRILLTTDRYRILKSVHHFHNMGFIHEDRAWSELREKIFGGDVCPPQMESIGKMIFRRYGWNYKAIQVISGILAAADRTEAAWEDISENVNMVYEDDDIIKHDKDLVLNYMYLPHHLRPCLLYLAIFPEDHVIHVSKLIKLWVAEGFLDESECKSFEETGEELVEDLVRRNLLWYFKRKSNGRIRGGLRMHNSMRKFCLRQAGVDNFFLHVSGFDSFDRQSVAMENQCWRRVSTCIYDDDFVEGVYGSTTRNIMLFLDDSELGSMRGLIGNVRLLRVLDMSNAYKYDLPEEVFELFHLRYLAFHCGFSISEAISNLENLQTLIIYSREKEFEKFGRLPEGIWRMPQLRHLIVFPFELPCLKQATSALDNLQTFSGVVDFICSRENLKMIPNLKKLAIFYSNYSRDVVNDFELYNLSSLQKLEILKIEMNRSSFVEAEHKMNLCAFPPTLKKLNLCGMQLPWEDMKIVASLPNLEVLKLRNHACIGETWETSEGGFSRLTYLLIEESDLMNWITESSHFPSLKSLVLYCCSHLSEVPNAMGKIPTLKLIEMDGQNHSVLCSAKKIDKDRCSSGDYTLHVTCKGKYL